MIAVLNKLQDVLDACRKIDFLAPLALRLYLAPVFIAVGLHKATHFADIVSCYLSQGLESIDTLSGKCVVYDISKSKPLYTNTPDTIPIDQNGLVGNCALYTSSGITLYSDICESRFRNTPLDVGVTNTNDTTDDSCLRFVVQKRCETNYNENVDRMRKLLLQKEGKIDFGATGTNYLSLDRHKMIIQLFLNTTRPIPIPYVIGRTLINCEKIELFESKPTPIAKKAKQVKPQKIGPYRDHRNAFIVTRCHNPISNILRQRKHLY